MFDYYKTPSQGVFDEVKEKAIELWKTYDDKLYVDEKVGQVQRITNVRDNLCYIVGMFDIFNMMRLLRMEMSPEAHEWLKECCEYAEPAIIRALDSLRRYK